MLKHCIIGAMHCCFTDIIYKCFAGAQLLKHCIIGAMHMMYTCSAEAHTRSSC